MITCSGHAEIIRKLMEFDLHEAWKQAIAEHNSANPSAYIAAVPNQPRQIAVFRIPPRPPKRPTETLLAAISEASVDRQDFIDAVHQWINSLCERPGAFSMNKPGTKIFDLSDKPVPQPKHN